MEIGTLNRRIVFKSWGTQQDEGGGAIAILTGLYTIWAKVESRSGQPYFGQQQQVWNYDYKITARYEKSRVIGSNYTIDYDGKRLAINSVSFENEGNRKYAVLRCTTTDVNIGTDTLAELGILTYDYFGVAHEMEFTADGTPKTAPNTDDDLRNKTIIGAFKDGIEFEVLLTGTPDSTMKQVLYIPATGQFIWSVPFEPGEHVLIQYLNDSIGSTEGSIVYVFTNETSFTYPHNKGRVVDVTIYDMAGETILGTITDDTVNHNYITVTFTSPTSGRLLIQ